MCRRAELCVQILRMLKLGVTYRAHTRVVVYAFGLDFCVFGSALYAQLLLFCAYGLPLANKEDLLEVCFTGPDGSHKDGQIFSRS